MFTCEVTKVPTFASTSLTVNHRYFTHSDISYTFNGKSDNVMLEWKFAHHVTNSVHV